LLQKYKNTVALSVDLAADKSLQHANNGAISTQAYAEKTSTVLKIANGICRLDYLDSKANIYLWQSYLYVLRTYIKV